MNQNLDVFTFIDNVRLGCLHLDIQTFIVLLFDQACIACVPGLCQDNQVFLQINKSGSSQDLDLVQALTR